MPGPHWAHAAAEKSAAPIAATIHLRFIAAPFETKHSVLSIIVPHAREALTSRKLAALPDRGRR
jgi:hypothetical protein